jgi:hypothetical protein
LNKNSGRNFLGKSKKADIVKDFGTKVHQKNLKQNSRAKSFEAKLLGKFFYKTYAQKKKK